MRIETKNFEILREVLKPLAKKIDDVKLKVEQNRILIEQTDPSIIMLVRVEIRDGFFERFETNGNKSIPINLESFLKRTKTIEKDSIVSFTVNESNLILVENNSFATTYTIPLVEINFELPETKELKWNSEFVIDTKEFYKALKKLKEISECFTIETTDNEVKLYSDEEDGKVEIKFSDIKEKKLTNTKSRFPIEYIIDFLSLYKIFPTVRINNSTDYPIKITFERDFIKMELIVAPRVYYEE
ncbi:MAG: hypothetical protein ACTSVB_05490 [Candidatus Heimdallarchaeaceae archaeon]